MINLFLSKSTSARTALNFLARFDASSCPKGRSVSSQKFSRQEHGYSQKGAISIYLALLLIFVMTTGTLILNQTLVKQIKIVNTITASERAYYAATSGLEEGLFKAKLLANEAGEVNTQQNVEPDISGDVSNIDHTATYKAKAGLYRNEIAGKRVDELCAVSIGTYRQETRRVIVASNNCKFD